MAGEDGFHAGRIGFGGEVGVDFFEFFGEGRGAVAIKDVNGRVKTDAEAAEEGAGAEGGRREANGVGEAFGRANDGLVVAVFAFDEVEENDEVEVGVPCVVVAKD
ncbi:hypothetical protein [Geminisphaera colitermitum]|uniref:hypothetical protein n=1 Tax=Geminisphaera colitermitum TaxID=1148786 RepID=UPI0002DEAD55|nr:hypothetical protein [Geminisphaera colitermitum]